MQVHERRPNYPLQMSVLHYSDRTSIVPLPRRYIMTLNVSAQVLKDRTRRSLVYGHRRSANT